MSTHTSIAVLADIHGNSLALKATLDDIARRGITRVVNLGDIFYGPLDPAGTWEILRELEIPTILGNQDRILLEGGPQWEGIPTFKTTVDGIGKDGMEWLRSLPATQLMDDTILLCHGTPKDDLKYLLEDITTGLPAVRDCTEMEDDILPEAIHSSLILAGHSHHPGLARCHDRTLINPGSVGLPAYDDDDPPHIMASGSPHAKYAIVERRDGLWDADFVNVEYNWQKAAEMARNNGREDWAEWLLTGMA
ncbi:metallophosphoesterase family protein [Pseudodesulfovibrio sp. zrk46]|uniref:metallophosphoesterase family protein n=1 Tax=Pseudodesulfovibrio sp. zrk46 TaxID=2725288 RepID=UPI001449E038|nr:metallophosphoesterase family protein [Pseudodesulfovibrio sp. zrk46]QJB55864.1 metallophosphoesterase family protein [Pseudodesulfovibrio sp. zrk46]